MAVGGTHSVGRPSVAKSTTTRWSGCAVAQAVACEIAPPRAALGGVAPADAVGDPQARKKLEDLFTELAGHHVRLSNLGLPSFDPHDLRRALGMEAASPAAARQPMRAVRTGPVKRNALLEELGTALTGGDVDSVAFFNVKTGAVEHFMHNLGDQETARISQADANEEMRKVAPVTTDVRYSIMSDFIGLVEDMNVAGRLRSAISGKGAFRRFREAVDEDDNLRRRWLSYRTKRHYLLALDWLQKLGLNPSQYAITPADYDWHPHAPLETPAAARDTAKRFNVTFDQRRLANDVTYNAQLGAAELGNDLEFYRGSYILAFVAYNAGRGRARDWIAQFGDPRDPKVDPIDWIERIPFTETRNYVQRVIENHIASLWPNSDLDGLC